MTLELSTLRLRWLTINVEYWMKFGNISMGKHATEILWFGHAGVVILYKHLDFTSKKLFCNYFECILWWFIKMP